MPATRYSLLATVIGCLALSGCSTSSMSRINGNRAAYESWPLEDREAILMQHAIPGMTKEMVRMAMGKPTEVTSQPTKDGTNEIWVYKKGGDSNSNLVLAVGGIAVGGSPGSSPEEEHDVVFQDDVVVRAD